MNLISQGWQCPVCKHVYSPSVSVCLYCPGEIVFTTTTNVINVDGMTGAEFDKELEEEQSE